MTSDSAISTQVDVLEALIRRRLVGRSSVRDLRVLVRGQGLVLQGYAPTYYAKQIAQHAATDVSGLPVLANEIEVR